MKTLILLPFMAALCSFTMHIPNQAQYLFKVEGGKVSLTVLLQSHEIQHYDPGRTKFSAIKTSQYILNHLKCVMDGKEIEFEFVKSESTKHYTYLRFTGTAVERKVQQVDIELDAFLHIADNFMNLVEFDVNGSFKSYTMTARAKQIHAEF